MFHLRSNGRPGLPRATAARVGRSLLRPARTAAAADSDLLARHAVAHVLAGGDDAFNDLVVPRTATQIAHHPGLDLLDRRSWLFGQQRRRGDDLTRSANAALKSTVSDECVLEWSQMLIVWCQAFDGGDVRTVDEHGWHQASAEQGSVHQHTAGAAHANAAALLGAGQPERIAEQIDQPHVGRDGEVALHTVEGEADLVLARLGREPHW